ncbi:MAG: dipeptidase PepE [Acidobacteriota bacterium]
MNKRLLLISNSTMYGQGYLEHCEAEIRDFLGSIQDTLFLPYALHDLDAYAKKARQRFAEFGVRLHSVHQSENPVDAVNKADSFFVGGGNTFRLLKNIYERNLLDAIRERVDGGAPYIGSSAGSGVATVSIRTSNDMPIVEPPSFEALGLVPFNLNAHYIDSDAASRHMGETREKRIEEFLEENDRVVVGIREGSMLRIEWPAVTLKGTTGARVFRRGADPQEFHPGDSLDFLIG